jgi:hypothetical protein
MHRSRRSRLLCLLLVLPALLFVVTAARPLHVHGADRTGLYDGECPLSEIAAARGQAATTPPPVSLWVPRGTGEAPPARDAGLPAPVALASASRAPPLA